MTLEELRAGTVFLVDKPLGWTSFDVVNKIRYTLKKTFGVKNVKVGHAGTLDPLASGLLVVCAGAETKNADAYQGREKEYTGSFTLGATTPSYDGETPVTDGFPTGHITEALIRETARERFTGDLLQRPPLYSALNIGGKRAYLHARKGVEVELEARPIRIERFDIEAVEMPRVDFRIACSKGTYIRSVAHDFGLALGSRAYLSALRRTRIGNFRIEDAQPVERIVSRIQSWGSSPDGPSSSQPA